MLIFFSVSGPVDLVPVVIETPLITEHVSVTFSELIRSHLRKSNNSKLKRVEVQSLACFNCRTVDIDENIDPFPQPSSSHFCMAFCLTHFSSSPSAQ